MQSVRRTPIRQVDFFLYPLAVKFSIGKAIYSKDVAIIFIQPVVKINQCRHIRKCLGGISAEPQPDGIGFSRADDFLYCQGVLLQGMKRFLPGVALMDVCAIGKVLIIS